MRSEVHCNKLTIELLASFSSYVACDWLTICYLSLRMVGSGAREVEDKSKVGDKLRE